MGCIAPKTFHLTREAHLNEIADELASCGHAGNAPVCHPAKWSEQMATNFVNGTQYPGEWKNQVLESIQHPEYETYLYTTIGWDDYHLTLIDGGVHSLLETRRLPIDRAGFCKLTHGWVSVGHTPRSSGKIKLCSKYSTTKTWEHVLR